MISATKPWQRRLTTVMMVTGLLVVMLAGLAGCARRDVSTLGDRRPSLDLAEFFAGQSVAYGIFEDRYGNLRRQLRVNMIGTVDGDTLTLAEDFLYDDGERAERTWVIKRLADDADGSLRYEGTASDVAGPASGRISGNALNWEYDVVLNISGREVEVHFDDWIYRQDEDVAINRAFVSKFGIEIGSVTLVFLRGAAAAAIGPLDLDGWPE